MWQETLDIHYRNAMMLIAAGCNVTPATDSYLGDAPEGRRVELGSLPEHPIFSKRASVMLLKQDVERGFPGLASVL